MRYRALTDHSCTRDDPIRFERGESIIVERQDEDFPGWWWCTDKRGKSGWVHESFFEEDDYRFVAREDYDGRELTVRAGEVVHGLDVRGGRALCQNAAGEIGWLPLTSLEPLEG
jgi:hypothetical protein